MMQTHGTIIIKTAKLAHSVVATAGTAVWFVVAAAAIMVASASFR
jgi:hypothetical protein